MNADAKFWVRALHLSIWKWHICFSITVQPVAQWNEWHAWLGRLKAAAKGATQ